MIGETISKRLFQLREHLGQRLNEDLTAKDVGEKCGLEKYTIYRLEQGLKGSTESLVALLLFYRNHGYNLDWILRPNNERIPMIIPAGRDLIAINETLIKVKQFLDAEQEVFSTQLRELGYRSFDALIPDSGEANPLSDPADPLSL